MSEQQPHKDQAAMTKPGNRGLRRLYAATLFSFKGFKAAWRQEEAFRTEVLLGIVLFPGAFWLGRDTVETLLLILSLVIVLLAELTNTAIESVVDRIGSEQHPLSGQAKDLGSSLVFISNMTVLLVWGLIAWDRYRAWAA